MSVEYDVEAGVVSMFQGRDTALIHLHGATLSSWKVNGEEILFLSEKAVIDGSKPIRGGIPLVFPHFGTWDKGPSLGFAQSLTWRFHEKEHVTGSSDYSTCALFILEDSEQTRAIWNFKFRLEYLVTLRNHQLETCLKVLNKSQLPFNFEALFHTYLRIPSIKKVEISPLIGTMKIDKLRDNVLTKEEQDLIGINGEVDSIYVATPNHITVNNVASSRLPTPRDHSTTHTRRRLSIVKGCLPDIVIWNPWVQGCEKIDDLAHDSFKHFVCVGAGHVAQTYKLTPGSSWEGGQKMTFEAYR
eukprot:gene9243-1525_t